MRPRWKGVPVSLQRPGRARRDSASRVASSVARAALRERFGGDPVLGHKVIPQSGLSNGLRCASKAASVERVENAVCAGDRPAAHVLSKDEHDPGPSASASRPSALPPADAPLAVQLLEGHLKSNGPRGGKALGRIPATRSSKRASASPRDVIDDQATRRPARGSEFRGAHPTTGHLR